MKRVNIPRSVPDPEYRYFMPPLLQKIEGKGINIRTNLINLRDVAKSLMVPHDYILKFMGYEFGSNVNSKNNVTSINGELNEDDVLKTLDKFIDKYILCPRCGFPETVLQVTDDKQLIAKCKTCGKVTDMDKKHKLTSYIIKNPPKDVSEMRDTRPDDAAFDTTTKSKLDLNELRQEIRHMIAQSSFSPLTESDSAIFRRINEYLNLLLPMNDDYKFDDSHVEVIYKGIKRLRLAKIYYDRVGYVLFSYLFDEGLLKQVDSRAILFEGVLKRHRLGEYIGHELLLNFQDFFYRAGSAEDWAKRIPTIFKKFYDQEMLSEVG